MLPTLLPRPVYMIWLSRSGPLGAANHVESRDFCRALHGERTGPPRTSETLGSQARQASPRKDRLLSRQRILVCEEGSHPWGHRCCCPPSPICHMWGDSILQSTGIIMR